MNDCLHLETRSELFADGVQDALTIVHVDIRTTVQRVLLPMFAILKHLSKRVHFLRTKSN